jgi:oligopeptidase B
MSKICFGTAKVPLSPAVRAGDFVFVSGQVPVGPDGRVVPGGIGAETRAVIDNIRAALALAGCGLEDVVKTTVWLRDRDDPSVRAHLDAENAYAHKLLAVHEPLAEQLVDEFKHRIVEDDVSVPVRRGAWEYFSKTSTGSDYPVHYRRPAREPSDLALPSPHRLADDEQLVLDENAEASGHAYFAVGAMAVTVHGNKLAWLRDVTGDERFTLLVRDLATGRDRVVAVDVSYGLAWDAAGETLYFVRHDDALRPHEVLRTTGTSGCELVFAEPDPEFSVSLGETTSGRFVTVTASSSTTWAARNSWLPSGSARPRWSSRPPMIGSVWASSR